MGIKSNGFKLTGIVISYGLYHFYELLISTRSNNDQLLSIEGFADFSFDPRIITYLTL